MTSLNNRLIFRKSTIIYHNIQHVKLIKLFFNYLQTSKILKGYKGFLQTLKPGRSGVRGPSMGGSTVLQTYKKGILR